MQFKRALAGKNFGAAWMLALELPPLPLVDALALLLLARDADPDRFVRGAVRVHARLCAEANLTLEEAQLVLAALDALRGPGSVSGASALMVVCEERGLAAESRVLRDWLGEHAPRGVAGS
jgi:hypothetical protein